MRIVRYEADCSSVMNNSGDNQVYFSNVLSNLAQM